MTMVQDELHDHSSIQIDITTDIEVDEGIVILSLLSTFPVCLTIELPNRQRIHLEELPSSRKFYVRGAFPEAGGAISIFASPVSCTWKSDSAAHPVAHAIHLLVNASGLVGLRLCRLKRRQVLVRYPRFQPSSPQTKR